MDRQRDQKLFGDYLNVARRAAVNLLIAAIVAAILIDALPQSPPPVRDMMHPVTKPVGLSQHWNVFAPPDSINTRLRAEITYRDGETREWRSPVYREQSPWQRFIGHRRSEWLDNVWGEEDEPIWPGWARYLARTMRPDLPRADEGATVRIIADDAYIAIPEEGPWTSWRAPVSFDGSRTLTIEKLR
jgi:hypothetical protein